VGPRLTKTLLVVRHAHRDKSQGRSVDNGLSKKGWAQAKEFTQFFERWYAGIPCRILSSPKLRCIETVKAIADQQGKPLEIAPELDEQKSRESEKAFKKRVAGFVRQWQKSEDAVLVLCSHGDWIPALFDELLGMEISLKKGAWLEVELGSPSSSRACRPVMKIS